MSYHLMSGKTYQKSVHISGHAILNQLGTLFSRKNIYEIKGSSKHALFLRQICATTIGKCIPLMYP